MLQNHVHFFLCKYMYKYIFMYIHMYIYKKIRAIANINREEVTIEKE